MSACFLTGEMKTDRERLSEHTMDHEFHELKNVYEEDRMHGI